VAPSDTGHAYPFAFGDMCNPELLVHFFNRCGKMTILCFNKYELNVILNKTQLSPHLESFSIYPHT
jgi:hypothetical protein